jgi:hypothetical protein
MADIKRECGQLAHEGAQRVAMAGFGVLCGWWYLVYRLMFETDLGWEVMEPVTVSSKFQFLTIPCHLVAGANRSLIF